MISWKTGLIGAGAAATLGILYMLRLKQAGEIIETITIGRIHKITFTKLIVRLDVTIKNPTSKRFAIQFPFVKLFHKEKVIGSSAVKDETIAIEPNQETNISNLEITISVSSLPGVAGELMNFLLIDSSQPITLKSTTYSTIHTGIASIPYQKEETLTI